MSELLAAIPRMFLLRRQNDYAAYVSGGVTERDLYQRAMDRTIVDFNSAVAQVLSEQKVKQATSATEAQSTH